MVRVFPTQAGDRFCSLPLALGLFLSVSALVALCAKQARRASRRSEPTTNESKAFLKSLLKSPKHLMTTSEHDLKDGKTEEEGFGEGGLWQKSILMGEKCQPLEFSGVIYYDCDGKRISELPPRSPRASPLHSFTFTVPKISS